MENGMLTAEEESLLNSVMEEAHAENNIEIKEEEKPKENKGVIPTNSSSLLVSEETSRFSSAIWYDKIREKNIVLAGVGGIGSYVAFLLSRVNPNYITVIDPDIVEVGNMSGQFYNRDNVGTSKVYAIRSIIGSFSNYFSCNAFNTMYTSNTNLTQNIMICGFDNMEARSTFFNSWYSRIKYLDKNEVKKCLFIDGRLAAEEFQVFCIKGDDEYNINRYRNDFLFSDSEAEETICSYKQTAFCANMIASCMVNLFVNFVANECDPLIPRDVPFLTKYDASTMFFKTEE